MLVLLGEKVFMVAKGGNRIRVILVSIQSVSEGYNGGE